MNEGVDKNKVKQAFYEFLVKEDAFFDYIEALNEQQRYTWENVVEAIGKMYTLDQLIDRSLQWEPTKQGFDY